ncbi:MAG: hypothetical protein ACK5F0_04150 [Flavobacteriales bacterium]
MRVKMRRAQFVILFIVLVLLLIPFLEQLDGKATFNWGFFDFLMAFLLFSSLGLGLELVIHKIQNRRRKILLIFSIIVLFVMLWGELAVGLFNSPIAGD